MIRTTRGTGFIVWMFSAAMAQLRAQPAFEAATVKVAASTTGGGRASTSGDRVVYTNTTLLNALARAFQVRFGNQIVGPSWISTERYDIVAKAADNTPKEQIPLMLQTLLVERFHLVLHHESKELPAYALITGKGPAKLVEDASNQKDSIVVSNGRREARSMSMAALAQLASFTLRVPVLDNTGLQGYYDFPYEVSQEETTQDSAPSIFTVVTDLGLKLEPRKAPLDVIVVDSGNKVPVEN